MKDLFKNKAMIATMISGFLIILGIVLQWQNFDTAAAIIFVLIVHHRRLINKQKKDSLIQLKINI